MAIFSIKCINDLCNLERSPFRTENLEPAIFAAKSVSIFEVIERWSGELRVLISPYLDTTTLSFSEDPKGTSSLGIFGISSKKLFIKFNKFCKDSSFDFNSALIKSIVSFKFSVSSPAALNLPN